MNRLQFGILGPLEVSRKGEQVPIGIGKQRELLALLLVRRNQAVSTDVLIDELWQGRPPDTAAKIVHNAVSSLRRVLGDGAELVLVTRGRGYELVVTPGSTDTDLFARLVDRGRTELADGHADDAGATLRQALALWRGAPLSDVAYHAFARSEIARLEAQRLAALEERVEADLATSRHTGLVSELEQLVVRHPLRERLRGQLMLALYRSGQQARSLEVSAEGRRRLADELGVQPSEALRRLEQAILNHDPALDAPRRPRHAVSRARRSPRILLAGAGAVVVIAAVVAALTGVGPIEAHHASVAIAVAHDSVAIIDPRTDRVVGDVAVGKGPSDVVTGAGFVWVLNAGDQTISRLDPATRQTVGAPFSVGITPASIGAGAGSLWISSNDAVLRIDADTGITDETIPLRGAHSTRTCVGGSGKTGCQLAVAGRSVFVWLPGAPSGGDRAGVIAAVARIDASSNRVVQRSRPLGVPGEIAAGLGGVWVRGFNTPLIHLNPKSLRQVGQSTPGGYTDIAVGDGGVWALDDVTVWHIDPTFDSVIDSIPVGVTPVGIAFGDNAVWVSAVDGKIRKIDPHTDQITRTIRVGDTPANLAVANGLVWVAVK